MRYEQFLRQLKGQPEEPSHPFQALAPSDEFDRLVEYALFQEILQLVESNPFLSKTDRAGCRGIRSI